MKFKCLAVVSLEIWKVHLMKKATNFIWFFVGDNMRSLKADLKLCNRATPGPWKVEADEKTNWRKIKGVIESEVRLINYEETSGVVIKKEDAKFIAESRVGWLYALKLLRQVAYSIRNNKGMNGAVYLDDRLEEQILTILEGEKLE